MTMLALLAYTFSLTLFAITAFIILLRVNVLITLLIFFPLGCIIALAQGMKKYRTAAGKRRGA